MRTQAFGLSDVGRTRDQNEDCFLVSPSLGLYVVADGLGGHASGEVASQLAAKSVEEYVAERKSLLERSQDSPGGHFKLIEVAEGAVQEACRRVYELASTDKEHAGMATTLTLLLVVDDKAIMAHVGDSRLYIIRNGKVHLISNDHTLVNELVQKGGIDPSKASASRMAHVLTRSVGSQRSVVVDTLLFDIVPDDIYLLCSDGLSNYLTDNQELLELLLLDDLETTGHKLVELANNRGGKDNITLILLSAIHDEMKEKAEAKKAQAVQLKLEILGRIPLFEGLPFNLIARILNHSVIQDCGAKERLITEGELTEGLFVVLDGRLTAFRGQEPVGDLGKGDAVGELALIRPRPARVTIQAEEASSVLLFPRVNFKKVTKKLPRLGCKLLRRLAEYACQSLDEMLSEGGLDGAHGKNWL